MQMSERANSISNLCQTSVRVQRSPTGRLLGCAVMLPAEIISDFVKDGAESLDIEFNSMPSGIMLKIGDDQR